MAAFTRRWLAVVLLSTLPLSMGCNLMALPFFLIPGMEPKIEAKCKLASKDKDKVVKVVIVASNNTQGGNDALRADHEISRLLALTLQKAFEKNKEHVKVVSPSQVERYKDEHSNWRSPLEVGEYFGTDYVIHLTINSFNLYARGSANTLFQANTSISIEVLKVRQRNDGPIYEEEYSLTYPRNGGVPAGDSNPAQFRQRFLNVVAKELSWRFTSHLTDEDTRTLDPG